MSENDEQVWKTKQLVHEGFPLYLRYPEKLDIKLYKRSFSVLAVITHELSKVRPNGLPDPDYNDGLLQFDQDIHALFSQKGIGQTALVETFAGKRRYYIYVTPKINIEENIASILQNHPDEKLSWVLRPDPDWKFINRYSKQFF